MSKQVREKQERVVEAVRHGLEGEAAVDFIRQSGFAMTSAGIARHLRSMGGRGRVQELISEGKTNLEILESCFPGEMLEELEAEPPMQGELFAQGSPPSVPSLRLLPDVRKIAIKVPEDLYQAIRIAAKAEGKSQNDLLVDILSSALSRLPGAE